MKTQVNITKNEAMNDYRMMNDMPTLAEKKAMAAKYGIDSKKAKDIQNAIMNYIRDIRKTQKTFDQTDVDNFNKLGYFDLYKKEAEMFAQESADFLHFLKDFRYEGLKRKGIEKHINSTDLRSRLSLNHVFAIKRYNNIAKYLEEQTSEYQAEQDNIAIIYNVLQQQMAEYKSNILDTVRKQAIKYYDKIPSILDELYAKFDIEYAKFDAWRKENQNANYYMYKEKSETCDKLKREIYHHTKIQNEYSAEFYAEYEVVKVSERFDDDVRSVSVRINKKDINVETMEVKTVWSDPKYFQMVIEDGKQKMYARSILAAEYSDLMVPHFRFIITNTK